MDVELWWFWLTAGILLLVAEMLTGTFYLLWLGLASLVAAGLAYLFPENLWLPPLAASITGLLLTLLSKPLTARARLARGFQDPVHDLVNKKGEVIEALVPGKLGIVRVGNEVWSAKAPEELPPGQRILVVNQSSTVLQVVPIK
ncbi:NfeD family protein [Rufibacter hautae]|uniref:NfeD family protein n=1 Tax=Rufibacter hautae TaxID=2595005 RepID=A0A5B6TFW7_9BACT|nr:NfeD family protein [Rufibacter hautae]KAA3439301.1 NfeD family protein [Rufibacter hautae]